MGLVILYTLKAFVPCCPAPGLIQELMWVAIRGLDQGFMPTCLRHSPRLKGGMKQASDSSEARPVGKPGRQMVSRQGREPVCHTQSHTRARARWTKTGNQHKLGPEESSVAVPTRLQPGGIRAEVRAGCAHTLGLRDSAMYAVRLSMPVRPDRKTGKTPDMERKRTSLGSNLVEVFHQLRIQDSNTLSIQLGPVSLPSYKLTIF